MGHVADDIEKYGRAMEDGEMTLAEAVSALVAATKGGLTPLGAADLLANWKTARGQYAKGAPVLPEDPAERLAFAQRYAEQARAQIADLDFAMKNGILPTRFQD